MKGRGFEHFLRCGPALHLFAFCPRRPFVRIRFQARMATTGRHKAGVEHRVFTCGSPRELIAEVHPAAAVGSYGGRPRVSGLVSSGFLGAEALTVPNRRRGFLTWI